MKEIQINHMNILAELIRLIEKESLEELKVFLEKQNYIIPAIINIQDKNRKIPLREALRTKNHGIIQLLIENGADIHETGKENIPMIEYVNKDTILILLKQAEKQRKMKFSDYINLLYRLSHEDEEYTRLERAILYRQPDIVKLLLDRGAKIYERGPEKKLILDYAEAEIPEIKNLLNQAISYRKEEASKLTELLNDPANINKNEVEKFIATYKLGQISAIINSSDKNGELALNIAILKDHVYVIWLLIDAGASIYATNNKKMTPLHVAANIQNIKIIKFILDEAKKGPRNFYNYINSQDDTGRTALQIAVMNGDKEKVIILLNAGADIKIKDKEDKTALNYAIDKDIENLLNGAIISNRMRIVNELINLIDISEFSDTLPINMKKIKEILEKEIGNNSPFIKDIINQPNENGKIVLNEVISKKAADKINIVKYLLENEANIYLKDDKLYTALHVAAYYKEETTEIIKFILNEAKKEPEKFHDYINSQNDRRQTPLHLAILDGNIEKVEMLLEAGAIIYILDKNGNTALDYAKKYGRTQIEKLLLEKITQEFGVSDSKNETISTTTNGTKSTTTNGTKSTTTNGTKSTTTNGTKSTITDETKTRKMTLKERIKSIPLSLSIGAGIGLLLIMVVGLMIFKPDVLAKKLQNKNGTKIGKNELKFGDILQYARKIFHDKGNGTTR